VKRNRLVIIGLGRIGRELLKKLPRDFEITCIDLNPDLKERARRMKGEDVRFIAGDATSRLVLEDAGVEDADVVIITTTNEKVNVEVARLLKEHFNTKRIISVGVTQENVETLEGLGVEVENIYTASATGIRNRIEQRSRAAHAIGLGKNEILEVEVHPNSRLANKPIGALAPIRWRIGIIYRDGNIIMPRKDRVLKPRDRVIILGDPAVLKTVSEILTFSFQRFPLEYGSTAIAYLGGKEDEGFFRELEYLFSVFPLNKIIFMYAKKALARSGFRELINRDSFKNIEERETVLSPYNAIESLLKEEKGEHGLIVLSKDVHAESFLPASSDLRKRSFLNSLASIAVCPILLSAGTFPYEKVVVPCVEGIDVQRVMDTAFEISSSLNNELTALLVEPSRYISTEEEVRWFEEMKKNISDMALVYKSSINVPRLKGNPVKAVTGVLSEYNLMIVDTGGWKKKRWLSLMLNPDVVWYIVSRSPISTLLIPPVEESL